MKVVVTGIIVNVISVRRHCGVTTVLIHVATVQIADAFKVMAHAQMLVKSDSGVTCALICVSMMVAWHAKEWTENVPFVYRIYGDSHVT